MSTRRERGLARIKHKPVADVGRIDAALKLAAHTAVHGNRKERAGRFLPLCSGCGVNYADAPGDLCPGCDAYREHQQ